MATRHLFVCPCGQKTSVEPSQAGQTLKCTCGAVHTLPTMRQISQLQPDPGPAASPAASAWSTRQRFVFLGAVLLGLSLLMAGVIGWNWPVAPVPAGRERIRAQIDTLSIVQTFGVWTDLLRGLDRRPPPERRAYREAVVWAQRWLMVAGGIGLAGVAAIGWGLVAARPALRG